MIVASMGVEDQMVTLEAGRIGQLLTLARDRSPESRARLAMEISGYLTDEDTESSAQERGIATEILRRLIHDIEVPIRRTLAERLARGPNVPRDLIIDLANDAVEVARPILLGSEMLTDEDLLEVIEHRTLRHRLTIAMRQRLSETLSAALVAAGENEVIRTLLENKTARIGRETFQQIVERSRGATELHEPLLRRHDLDAKLAVRMYGWVSAALQRHIAMNYDVDQKLLGRAIADAFNEIIADHGRVAALGDTTDKLAAALAAGTCADPTILVGLLRAGEVALFEAVFARLAGLPISKVRRAIYEPGGKALAQLCKTNGIDKHVFATMFLLARQARPDERMVDPRELRDVLGYYDKLVLSGRA
jgi:uncharacterized protein (DUF2336 family)